MTLARVIEQGYGSGAWHGADMKAAIRGVTQELAFWRPAPARHNIAEIALHHAWCARGVRGQLAGTTPEPFVLEGEDWFDAPDERRLAWTQVVDALDAEQRRLAAAVADIGAGRLSSPTTDDERASLVLGITCHAIYHAGQIQLIKRLREGAN